MRLQALRTVGVNSQKTVQDSCPLKLSTAADQHDASEGVWVGASSQLCDRGTRLLIKVCTEGLLLAQVRQALE